MVAAAVAGGSAVAGLASSAIGSSGASAAGKAQADAATAAANQQYQMFQQSQANLAPYSTMGKGNLGAISAFPGQAGPAIDAAYANVGANVPQLPDQAWLQNTPGYQFNLAQGLKATQNSAAARGLGVSGAALKGAATYATGLADSTYQNQFANAQTRFGDYNQQFQNAVGGANAKFTYLMQPATLGENAAATSGYQGVTAGSNIGNAMQNAGQATAAGISGSTNALTSGIQGLGQAPANYLMAQQMFGNTGGFGSSNASDPYNGTSGLTQGTLNTIANNSAQYGPSQPSPIY